MVGPLGSGLKDSDSPVRLVAASGVLKLYYLSALARKFLIVHPVNGYIPTSTQDFGGMDDTFSSQIDAAIISVYLLRPFLTEIS